MFEKISIHTPRQFVPTELNPGEWPSLEPLFDQLEQQLTDASDAAQLEQAILNWEELSAALAEEGSKRYICLLYTSPSPRDKRQSRMPSSA